MLKNEIKLCEEVQFVYRAFGREGGGGGGTKHVIFYVVFFFCFAGKLFAFFWKWFGF